MSFKKLIEEKLKESIVLIEQLQLDEVKKTQLKTNWLKSIGLMEYLTKTNYLRYNILNLTSIIAGALIPVILNITYLKENDCAIQLGSILGVIVSISISINQSYRFNDRWRHFRYIAEALKIEGERFFSLSESYYSYNDHNGGAFKQFMGNVEKIKEEQIHTYIQKVLKEEHRQEKKSDTTTANKSAAASESEE